MKKRDFWDLLVEKKEAKIAPRPDDPNQHDLLEALEGAIDAIMPHDGVFDLSHRMPEGRLKHLRRIDDKQIDQVIRRVKKDLGNKQVDQGNNLLKDSERQGGRVFPERKRWIIKLLPPYAINILDAIFDRNRYPNKNELEAITHKDDQGRPYAIHICDLAFYEEVIGMIAARDTTHCSQTRIRKVVHGLRQLGIFPFFENRGTGGRGRPGICFADGYYYSFINDKGHLSHAKASLIRIDHRKQLLQLAAFLKA